MRWTWISWHIWVVDEEWLAVAEWEGEQQVKDDVRAVAQRKDDENET
jgi:hypothetical protein